MSLGQTETAGPATSAERSRIELIAFANQRWEEAIAFADKRRETSLVFADKRRETSLVFADKRREELIAFADKRLQEAIASANQRRMIELFANRRREEKIAYAHKRREEMIEFAHKRHEEMIEFADKRRAEMIAAANERYPRFEEEMAERKAVGAGAERIAPALARVEAEAAERIAAAKERCRLVEVAERELVERYRVQLERKVAEAIRCYRSGGVDQRIPQENTPGLFSLLFGSPASILDILGLSSLGATSSRALPVEADQSQSRPVETVGLNGHEPPSVGQTAEQELTCFRATAGSMTIMDEQ